MSFWGMSQTGRDARNNMNQLPNWMWDRARMNWGESDQQRNRYNESRQVAGDFWRNRMNQDFTPVSGIRARGQEIMPGVDQAIQNRWNRFGQMGENIGNFQGEFGARPTLSQINSNLDTMGTNLTGLYNDSQGDINDTAQRAGDRQNAAYSEQRGNVRDSFGSARNQFNTALTGAQGDWNSAYGGMRSNARNTFSGLLADTAGAYGRAEQGLQALRPGGDAQIAQTARSFAPMMANTQGRIRRAGVDPNSVQATSIMNDAEAERARGMDDRAAANARDFVDRSTSLILGGNDARNALSRAGLGMDVDLGAAQAGGNRDLTMTGGNVNRDLTLNEGNVTRGLIGENAANLSTIDRDRSGRTTELQDRAFGYGNNILGARNNALTQGRQMGLQDLALNNELLAGMNENELTNLNLQNQQYDRGMQYEQIQRQLQDAAAAQYGNLSRQDLAALQYFNDAGNQQAGMANQGWQNTLARESANAGWGSRLLGGLGLGALNYFVPGLGSALGGSIPGMGGAGGGFNLGGIMSALRPSSSVGRVGGSLGMAGFNPNFNPLAGLYRP